MTGSGAARAGVPGTDLLASLRERGIGDAGEVLVLGPERPEEGAHRGRATWLHLTLDDLERRADRHAAGFAAAGARAGAVHPVTLEPDVDGVVGLLALWRMGAVPAPLNPRLTPAEREAAVATLAGADPGDAWVVLWTSGTSGRPRGVALSREAVFGHVSAAADRLGLVGGRDTWLATLSVAHVGGLMVVVRALLTGSRLLAAGTLGADGLLPLLGEEGPVGADRPVSHVSLVPTQLLRILDATRDRPAPPGLRCVLLGGAHTPRPLLERALEAGWPVALTWGMTEMASQVATALPDRVRTKPGSVGRPLDGVEVRVDADGELQVRGPAMASGYLDGTPVAGPDGWYRTGDLGRVDEDGDVWITGRRSDRIVSGGVNVDAAEVEEELRRHPEVADACVAGLPDGEWGEVVGAALVPGPRGVDPEAVGAWLRDRVSPAKRPRRWITLEALPTNANGKVDREAVRALFP